MIGVARKPVGESDVVRRGQERIELERRVQADVARVAVEQAAKAKKESDEAVQKRARYRALTPAQRRAKIVEFCPISQLGKREAAPGLHNCFM